MNSITEIFTKFGIKEAYYLENEMLSILIVKRDGSYSMAKWINLIDALKLYVHKEIEFLNVDDIKKKLSSFSYYKENSHE